MPVEIELSPDKTRVALLRREEGRVTASFRFDPLSTKGQEGAAVKAGLSVTQLLQYLDSLKQTGQPQRFTLGPPIQEPDAFVVRGIEQQPEDGVQHVSQAAEFLTTTLSSVPVEKVVTWTNTEVCCCLDVDYHESRPPDRPLLESIIFTRLAPRPFAWHFSRGGGLHLFYIGAEGFAAEELAAVAALRFRMIDPTAGVELKRVVRGPGADKVVLSGIQDTAGTLLEWLREPEQNENDTEAYLAEEGLEIGKRYDHNKCPHSPSEDGGKHRAPVIVRENGIHCFVCEGHERLFGSRRPGFFPWAAILGQPSAGDVGIMVRQLCHWGHAKWVLQERYGLNGGLAKKAYSAALKAYHQGTSSAALIPMAFDSTLDKYSRVGEEWLNLDDLKPFSNGIRRSVEAMPTTCYVNAKGEVKPNQVKVTNLLEAMNTRDWGYPPISLIFGTKMAAEYIGQGQKTIVARPNPGLGGKALPQYVPFSSRMPLDKARQVIEEIVPRTDWSLIQLILCGIGSSQETELGLPPRMFVTGPSRSAKTAHFEIAAGIAGVQTASPTVQGTGEERLRQAVMESMNTGPIVLINEIFKDAHRNNKQNPVQALQPLLSMDKNTLTHVLYKGPRRFPRQFVLGFTEVQMPVNLRTETQIARRLVYHRLEREKRDWPRTIAAAGVTDLHLLRLASPEVAAACDAVLSDVVDHFFLTPTPFQAQAEQLGIKTLEESDEGLEWQPYLKLFFKLVCEAPPIQNERLAKMYPGFVEIPSNSDDVSDEMAELVATYTQFADGPNGKDWYRATQLIEKDWNSVVGYEEDTITFTMTSSGTSVFVRFQTGPVKKPRKINSEILDTREWRPVL